MRHLPQNLSDARDTSARAPRIEPSSIPGAALQNTFSFSALNFQDQTTATITSLPSIPPQPRYSPLGYTIQDVLVREEVSGACRYVN